MAGRKMPIRKACLLVRDIGGRNMSRTYGTPHIAVYIYQPLKWQATFVLPLWGVFGGIFADNH